MPEDNCVPGNALITSQVGVLELQCRYSLEFTGH